MDPFRVIFRILFFAMVLLQSYYGFKGRGSAKEHVSERGVTAVRLTAGLVFLATVIGYMAASRMLMRTALPLGALWRWTGAVIWALALALLVWVDLALGEHYSTELRVRTEHSLVQRGPYRFVRHPMYSAVLLVMIGAGLLSANWLIAASGLVVIGAIMLLRAPMEEKMLTRAFGEQYREYAAGTGRFFPRLGRSQ